MLKKKRKKRNENPKKAYILSIQTHLPFKEVYVFFNIKNCKIGYYWDLFLGKRIAKSHDFFITSS